MYIVVTPEGRLVEQYDTDRFVDAVKKADSEFPEDLIVFDGDVHMALADERKKNPRSLPILGQPGQRDFPEVTEAYKQGSVDGSLAHSRVGRIDPREVERLSEKEAYERLRPWLPLSFLNWSMAAEKLLTENAKLGKALEGAECYDPFRKRTQILEATASYGLSLLPAFEILEAQKLMLQAQRMGHPSLLKRKYAEAWSPLKLPDDISLCWGSTKECRQTCLVLQGRNDLIHNAIDEESGCLVKVGVDEKGQDIFRRKKWPIGDAMISKARKTEAFLADPVAFMKLLRASLEHYAGCIAIGLKKFARLNIFSDIPWEVVYPEIFDGWGRDNVPPLDFYDYTKLDGRDTTGLGAPYQLTYSYSGQTKEANRILQAGGKVAMVFFLGEGNVRPKTQKGFKPWSKTEWQGLTYNGYPVYDGDCHDIRPYDPPETRIVGLQYKPPNLQKHREIKYPKKTKFLVYAEKTEVKGVLVVPASAGQLGAFEFEEKAGLARGQRPPIAETFHYPRWRACLVAHLG